MNSGNNSVGWGGGGGGGGGEEGLANKVSYYISHSFTTFDHQLFKDSQS